MKQWIKKLVERTGYTISRLHTGVHANAANEASADVPVYDQDGLRSVHNHDFMKDPLFARAYHRGCMADSDYRIHWRIHIGIWAAVTASKLEGDFVECGVNRGFLSSSIMEFLDWDSMERSFYLVDTFAGLSPQESSSEELERADSIAAKSYYCHDVESVIKNFSQWRNVRIIQGTVPQTLDQVDTQNVAYLHLDMNCASPEVAALEFFWDRLAAGAVVLLDDYAYRGFESQKYAMDQFALRKGLSIASLPTGQGLLLRPPHGL
jgi:hypothetical protein